jgi:tetratricopeptide (TPR) repeat protein
MGVGGSLWIFTTLRRSPEKWGSGMKIRSEVLLPICLSIILIASLGTVCLQGQTTGEPKSSQIRSTESANAIAAQAQHALIAGNYIRAIELYRSLAKIAPGVAEIHSNLAVAYYQSGQFADAAREAQTALRLSPTLLNAHYFLGLSLAESGYCREALPYLKEDFSRVEDPKLKRVIGTDGLHCSMALSHVNRAINYDQILTREFPDDPEILYLTTHLFSELSTRASQLLVATSPGSYQVYRMNAEVMELQGKLQDAIAEYDKVQELDPHVPGIHYEIGKILLQQNHDLATLHKAKKEFEAELQIDPGNARAEYQLGQIASISRDWNKAIAHLQHAVNLDPQLVPALVSLGKAYAASGQVKEAIAPLERAIELDPNNADAHYRLSFVYRRLGRIQEADHQLVAYKQAYQRLQKFWQDVRELGGNLAKSDASTTDH